MDGLKNLGRTFQRKKVILSNWENINNSIDDTTIEKATIDDK